MSLFLHNKIRPLTQSSDCFASDRMLSEKLGRGDLLAILSTGAYGFTMSSNYNTRPRPPEVLVKDGKFRVIRERENYEDLIRAKRSDTGEKSVRGLKSWDKFTGSSRHLCVAY